MSIPLFLFCGGVAIDSEGHPKPLIKVKDGLTLIRQFLNYLKNSRASDLEDVTLLCDSGQEDAFLAELDGLSFPFSVHVQKCGAQASTFEKFEFALRTLKDKNSCVHFGYPDIFFFGEYNDPTVDQLEANDYVYISAAPLTSRFPRLIIDVYKNQIRGISDYNSPVPANPMHVFGGDLWGKVHKVAALVNEFRSTTKIPNPSLEYDFFYWLVNKNITRCVIQHGERIWVDSIRDTHKLLAKLEKVV